MKCCLTVRPPWAQAIFILGKGVENRSWYTNHRGLLYIHAGVRTDPAGLLLVPADRLTDPLLAARGVILGSVELVDCVRDARSRWAAKGAWHWVLENPRLLRHPIPAVGRLGFWRF